MKVLLTGATGLVGKEIGKALVIKGHQVVVVSRNAQSAKLNCPFPCQVIEADLGRETLKSELVKDIEAVIHLAGESVAESRWSQTKKDKIYNSRVLSTRNLLASLAEAKASVKVFVSTSASGYYGDRGEQILLETSPQGEGFLADVCRDWEREVEVAQAKNFLPQCRYAILRVGVVISPFGGAMMKMIPPFRLGLGGAVGSGKQWMGWIHIEDLVEVYLHCLEFPQYQGVINAVAPETLTNYDFSKKLAAAFGKKIGPALPEAIVKLMFGEMAHVVLSSQRIESQVLHRLGFRYRYATLESAFQQTCEYYQNQNEILFAQQYLPYTLEQVFPFFCDAKNLESITPPLLNFKVLKMATPQIQSGTLLDYRLKIHGIPVFWRTEILDWNPPYKFTDTQLKGPYQKWHHTHEFSKMSDGVLMTDLVRYKLPLGLLGWSLAFWFVARDVRKIFEYRRKVCAGIRFEDMSKSKA